MAFFVGGLGELDLADERRELGAGRHQQCPHQVTLQASAERFWPLVLRVVLDGVLEDCRPKLPETRLDIERQRLLGVVLSVNRRRKVPDMTS